MSLVSIIIPIYNIKKYIRRCLDSVINQTYKDIEIICVNDGSTDGSLEVLKEYELRDNRIKIINIKHLGVSEARNIGIENSCGEYIVFVDGDDWIENNLVEQAYDRITKTASDIVIYSLNDVIKNRVEPNLRSYEILNHYENKEIPSQDIMDLNRVITDRMICKKFLINNNIKFDAELKNNEDVVFNLLCMYKNAKVCCLPQNLYNYTYIRKGSAVDNSKNIVKNEIRACEKVIFSDIYKNISDELKIATLNKFLYGIIYRYNEDRNRFYRIIYNYQIKKFLKKLSENIDFNILKMTIYPEIKDKYSCIRYFIDHIFSVKNSTGKFNIKYKNIIIFGLKIQIKISTDKQEIKKFNNNKINQNSILIVEANVCHGETIPGYAKMFTDLGYNVDILITNAISRDNPLCCLQSNCFNNIFSMSVNGIEDVLKSTKIKDYKYVFLNSFQLYYNNLSRYSTTNVFKFFDSLTKSQNGFIAQEHHLDMVEPDMLKEKRILQLGNINPDVAFCNSHYFGEIEKHNKNDITQFVVVGSMVPYRKNSDGLVKSVEYLIENGIKNFHVNIIGSGSFYMPRHVQEYVTLLGRLPFKDMYDYMKKSDFILALLDPDNEEHQRYITAGTSGTFQLSYGFLKPILIHSKFAQKHYLNDNNAIIYNDDFNEALIKCINMSKTEYNGYIENLDKTVKEIEMISLKNLKEVLEAER